MTDKMKNNRSFCLSISKRNEEVVDLIEEYSEMLGLSKAQTVFYMLKEYPKLKAKERERELEQVRQVARETELKEIVLEALKEYHSVPDWQRTHPHWTLDQFQE